MGREFRGSCDTLVTPTHIPDHGASIAVFYAEPAEWLGLAGTVHADMLSTLAADLGAEHVFAGLTDGDAKCVAELVAVEVIRSDFALTDAAAALDDRASGVLTDRSGFDDRNRTGVALHRAARVLAVDGKRSADT